MRNFRPLLRPAGSLFFFLPVFLFPFILSAHLTLQSGDSCVTVDERYGSFAFTRLANGAYYVQAGDDESADGAIGVLYYDMRNDTADRATLLVDAWLTTSSDGITWTDGALPVCAAEDVQRHAILDAAGQVELLGLGVDRPQLAVEATGDGQQGSAANGAGQPREHPLVG